MISNVILVFLKRKDQLVPINKCKLQNWQLARASLCSMTETPTPVFSQIKRTSQCWLVVLTILKNMKVNGKDDPIYYGKFQTCLKPPTSNVPLANPAWSSFYSPNFQRIRRQTLNDKRHRAPSRVFSRAEMWPSPQKG